MNSPIGLILGSGWGKISGKLKNSSITPYRKIFGRDTAVPGHKGEVIKGRLGKSELIILSGRFHIYEGYSPQEAVKTIDYLHSQKVKKVIITSACGALNPKYSVADLVIHSDMISIFCPSVLKGAKFQNLSAPYNAGLIAQAQKAAALSGLDFHKGVYVYQRGPNYETFADKMALRVLGADVVGMSTVPEVIKANYFGMEVLGLSLVTNLAFVKHNHKEVLLAGKKMEDKLKVFLQKLVELI